MIIINRNKMKRKKMLISKKIKETKRGTTEGTKVLKRQNSGGTFPKGQKKREKKRIARQHKLNEEEERKVR